MKNLFSSLMVLTFIVIASSCNKEGSSGDLTRDIVGLYKVGSGSGSATITVNKIDNSTVSIAVDEGGTSSYAFTSVKMNSATAFTLNSITINARYCSGNETITGTGTYTGNNISLFYSIATTGNGTIYGCTAGNSNQVISATK